MSKRSNKSILPGAPSVDELLPPIELSIIETVKAMGTQMKTDYDMADDENTPLDFYAEQYLENLSEAGYSETRPNDRLSIRAFGNLFRIKAEDLKTLKSALGVDGGTYKHFALCDTMLEAISKDETLAPAFAWTQAPAEAKSTGPFYPERTELTRLDVLAAALSEKAIRMPGSDKYAPYMLKMVGISKMTTHDAVPSNETMAIIRLASAIRFNRTDLQLMANKLWAQAQTFSSEMDMTATVRYALARVVLDAVRSSLRFVAGARFLKEVETGTRDV